MIFACSRSGKSLPRWQSRHDCHNGNATTDRWLRLVCLGNMHAIQGIVYPSVVGIRRTRYSKVPTYLFLKLTVLASARMLCWSVEWHFSKKRRWKPPTQQAAPTPPHPYTTHKVCTRHARPPPYRGRRGRADAAATEKNGEFHPCQPTTRHSPVTLLTESRVNTNQERAEVGGDGISAEQYRRRLHEGTGKRSPA